MMLSDFTIALLKEWQKEDAPVNILIDNQYYDIGDFFFDNKIGEYQLKLEQNTVANFDSRVKTLSSERDKILDILNGLYDEYLTKKKETPFYHNTEFCHACGRFDEITCMYSADIDEGGLYCYIVARIEALKELKKRCLEKGI